MNKAKKRDQDRQRRRARRVADANRAADDAATRSRLSDLKAAREARNGARPDRDDAALAAKRKVLR